MLIILSVDQTGQLFPGLTAVGGLNEMQQMPKCTDTVNKYTIERNYDYI